MVTIKEILEQKGFPYFDKKLHWGANLSEYREELAKVRWYQTPVLIELQLNIDFPQRTVVIDHHNERAGKYAKTSIEQVAKLLKIKLDRHQQLVSANDRGHVPAMMELGATLDEIREIRSFDRACQGVSPEDEKKAEDAIKLFSELLTPNAIYVMGLTEKTSPIMDRLYNKFPHIVIVTPNHGLSYFGPGPVINALETAYVEFKRVRPTAVCWKGGNLPDYGFFGSNVALEKRKIQEFIVAYENKKNDPYR